jgi:integrase
VRLRLHITPTLGRHEVRLIKPATVQTWVKGLQGALAANYVRVVLSTLSTILNAAVDEGLIARNPCSANSVRAPAPEKRRVTPWPAAWIAGVHGAMPDRYREMVTAGAGLGLRQGEVFGLAVEDVDWLRKVVHVRRQVRIVGGRLVFSPPKGGKQRDVPLPDSVALRLSKHLQDTPAQSVTLPWRVPTGKPVTAVLLFTHPTRGALDRSAVNRGAWKPALKAAGVPDNRDNGMHALRHYFASVVLDGGANIKALAAWLGHTDPGFTLRVYTHLMPEGDDRMRRAVDGALTAGGAPDVRQADA